MDGFVNPSSPPTLQKDPHTKSASFQDLVMEENLCLPRTSLTNASLLRVTSRPHLNSSQMFPAATPSAGRCCAASCRLGSKAFPRAWRFMGDGPLDGSIRSGVEASKKMSVLDIWTRWELVFVQHQCLDVL